MLPHEDEEYGMSGMAEAMKSVSVVTSFVGVMIVPALGGIWIDSRFGTRWIFSILGMLLGFAGGMYSLLKMVKAGATAKPSR